MKSLVKLMSILMLSGCAQVQLASHAIKSVPFPSETPKTQGTFKVGNPYKIDGRAYFPKERYVHSETGIASWYGPKFHGKMTANGEIFNKNELTAAHRTLQLPSLIRVTNLNNGRSLILRVNDRGPYSRGRVLDVSERGAELLGFKQQGTAKIKLEVLTKESRQIAQMAKEGKSTSGIEVTMNRDGSLPAIEQNILAVENQTQPSFVHETATTEKLKVVNVTSEPLDVSLGNVRGDLQNGRFLPDEIVQEVPVPKTSIYVQLGSFSDRLNAQSLQGRFVDQIRTQIVDTDIHGQTFHRVRLGPFETVDQADRMLASVVDQGVSDAIIVVD